MALPGSPRQRRLSSHYCGVLMGQMRPDGIDVQKVEVLMNPLEGHIPTKVSTIGLFVSIVAATGQI
jgi:hypothetical protein